jgi:hypothetical protein
MKTRVLAGSLAATAAALGIGQFSATALPGGDDGQLPSDGPDVIVGDIPDIARYSTATYLGKTFASYAVGTTSCNVGSCSGSPTRATCTRPSRRTCTASRTARSSRSA